MNVIDVMAEMAEKLGTITGLRVTPYRPDSLAPPAAFPDLPERITFDGTYRRGMDQLTMPVVVVVGRVSDRASHKEILAYAAGSGPSSFKAKLDSSTTNTYTACDTVTVKTVDFVYVTLSAVNYLAAEFSVDIAGSGS